VTPTVSSLQRGRGCESEVALGSNASVIGYQILQPTRAVTRTRSGLGQRTQQPMGEGEGRPHITRICSVLEHPVHNISLQRCAGRREGRRGVERRRTLSSPCGLKREHWWQKLRLNGRTRGLRRDGHWVRFKTDFSGSRRGKNRRSTVAQSSPWWGHTAKDG